MGEEDRCAHSGFDRFFFGTHIPTDLFWVWPPAIICGEYEKRIIIKILLLQKVHQLTAALIEPGDVGPIASGRFIRGEAFIFQVMPIRSIVGSVRQEDGVPNKKRLSIFLCLVYKVVNWLHGLAANLVTTTFVESMVERISFPPFSGLQCGIPDIL